MFSRSGEEISDQPVGNWPSRCSGEMAKCALSSWHKDRLEVRARMFFYGVEDPATESAAGCAASWMVQHGIANSEEQVVIRQGVEIGRPSEMYMRATREDKWVTNVRMGGYAVEVLRGTVTL